MTRPSGRGWRRRGGRGSSWWCRPTSRVAVLGVIGRAEDMHADPGRRDRRHAGLSRRRVRGAAAGGAGPDPAAATEGLVYARTRHATSRAGDPEPHDHVLVANLVEMLRRAGRLQGAGHGPDARPAPRGHDGRPGRGGPAGGRVGLRDRAGRRPVREVGALADRRDPSRRCEALFSKRAAEIDAAVAARGHRHLPGPPGGGPQHPPSEAAHAGRGPDGRLAERARRRSGYSREELSAAVAEAGRSRTGAAWATPRPQGSSSCWPTRCSRPDGRLAESKVFTRADVVVAVAPALFGRDPAELLRAGRVLWRATGMPSRSSGWPAPGSRPTPRRVSSPSRRRSPT